MTEDTLTCRLYMPSIDTKQLPSISSNRILPKGIEA